MRWLAVTALVVGLSPGAAAYPTVFVSPSYLEVGEGDTFTMGIRVDAGTDTLTCFLVEFEFDPDIVELTSADEGTLFTECGYGTMYDWDVLGPGHHSCNDVTLGYWAYAICPGELVHLTCRASSWGTSAVHIVAVDLRDIEREPIQPVEAIDATITVMPATGVEEDTESGNARIVAAPNPCRGSTTLTLGSERSGRASELRLYDAAGQLVRYWYACPSGHLGAAVGWDGTRDDGSRCPSGVYFAVARVEGGERRGRVVLVR